jgi:hypothetical protein
LGVRVGMMMLKIKILICCKNVSERWNCEFKCVDNILYKLNIGIDSVNYLILCLDLNLYW